MLGFSQGERGSARAAGAGGGRPGGAGGPRGQSGAPRARRSEAACLGMAWASLSLMWTWLNVSGRSGYLARSYTLADQAASYACCLAALVLIALLARRLWARPAVLSLAGAACIVAGSAVSAAVGQPVGDGARLAAGAGLLLSGIGYMPCLIGLLFGLARAFPYRLAPPVVLLAVLFRQQASPLLALLPSDAQVRAIAVLLAVFAGPHGLLGALGAACGSAWTAGGARRACGGGVSLARRAAGLHG